jgi:hypothetical protein
MRRSATYLRRSLFGAAILGSLGFGATQAFGNAADTALRTCPATGYDYAYASCRIGCASGGYCSADGICRCGQIP